MNADLVWEDGMHFKCNNREFSMSIDISKELGGTNLGPTPKELILNAMMGCTAMDVVAILKKMRQEIKKFQIKIEVEKNQLPPVHFKKAILTFELEGNIIPEKAIKAVESSLQKYCGVNYMISKVCEISYILKLNKEIIKEGNSAFIDPSS